MTDLDLLQQQWTGQEFTQKNWFTKNCELVNPNMLLVIEEYIWVLLRQLLYSVQE